MRGGSSRATIAAMDTQQRRRCALQAAVGRDEVCSEQGCPFWEPGGAVLGGRCAFEQLGLPADPGLAAWLLELRGRLASAKSSDDEEAVRDLFRHLVNESAE
jgi:hypothetical protein